MSSYFPDPLAPETVNPTLLAKVTELHGTVRQWLEDSAVALKNQHVRANLPYADLMFAFGFATLGDHPSATRLMSDARKLLEGPKPPPGNHVTEGDPTSRWVVRDVILKAISYRIAEAMRGNPHTGPLSAEVQADLRVIDETARASPNNPYQRAEYVIGRFREQFRIPEPTERIDPYASWTKNLNNLKKALHELRDVREPDQLAEHIRRLSAEGVPGNTIAEVRFCLL